MSIGGSITNDDMMGDYAYKSLRWDMMGRILSAGVGLEVGAVPSEELDAGAISGQAGMRMATSDEIYWGVSISELLQAQFDLTKDIEVQILYMTDGGASDTAISWSVDLKGFAAGAAIGDCKVSADGSVTWTGLVGPVADGPAVTPWRSLALTASVFASDLFVGVAATLASSGGASADELKLISCDLRGTKAVCTTDGSPRKKTS